MQGTLLALALLANTTSSAAILAPGDHTIELKHGGIARSYIVHVPRGRQDGAFPVVLNFHGGGGNAQNQQRYSGMDRIADREHFLAVYPDGTGRTSMRTWNAGTCCGYAAANQIDDVGFVRAVITDLARKIPVDRTRIYATGLSNGAMMSYRLAAEASDLVAAIAPVAGSMVLVRFNPSRPVPVMHIHSVDDPRALYAGGLGPPFPMTNSRVEHPPVEQQLAKWIAHNGCPATSSLEKTLHGHSGTSDESNGAAKYVYAPCTTGATVVLWKLRGSGHVWPGSDRTAPWLLGRPTHLIDANEEIWAFFRNLHR
jgi:polyhydroxybutyrate depolymerase